MGKLAKLDSYELELVCTTVRRRLTEGSRWLGTLAATMTGTLSAMLTVSVKWSLAMKPTFEYSQPAARSKQQKTTKDTRRAPEVDRRPSETVTQWYSRLIQLTGQKKRVITTLRQISHPSS